MISEGEMIIKRYTESTAILNKGSMRHLEIKWALMVL